MQLKPLSEVPNSKYSMQIGSDHHDNTFARKLNNFIEGDFELRFRQLVQETSRRRQQQANER